MCKSNISTLKGTLLIKAPEITLKEHANNGQKVQKLLFWVIYLCLKNVTIQYQNRFYSQKIGFISESNNSAWLVNLALHYVVCQVFSEIKSVEIFKHFVDDIPRHSLAIKKQNMKAKLSKAFANFDLTLNYRLVEIQLKKMASWKFLIDFIKVFLCPEFNASPQTILNLPHLIVALLKVPHIT